MHSRYALLLALSVAATGTHSQTRVPHAVPSASDLQSLARLPEGPGKALVMQYCAGACHEVLRIDESQGTHAEWVTRVRRMIRRGAVIPAEQIEPIATYLAAVLPPRVRAQSAHSSPIAVTFGEVAVRPIQTWVRAAATLQPDVQTLSVMLPTSEVAWVKPGQRVRAFAMSSRSSMLQARVVRVFPEGSAPRAEVRLSVPAQPDRYLVEIVAEREIALSIPNEAIIEEGEHQVVYVLERSGDFQPRKIKTGIQGELFTQVLEGLEPAEQVVTFGSFFIDAEYKMKSGR